MKASDADTVYGLKKINRQRWNKNIGRIVGGGVDRNIDRDTDREKTAPKRAPLDKRKKQRQQLQKDAARTLSTMLIYWQNCYNKLSLADMLYVLESVVSSVVLTRLREAIAMNDVNVLTNEGVDY